MGKSTSGKSAGGSGKVVGIIVAIAILAIAGGAAWYLFLRSTPEKTVAKFMDAATLGNSEVAKTCLSESSLKSWDRIAPLFKQGDQKDKKDKGYTIGKSTASGSTVTVPVTTQVPPQAAAFLGGKTSIDVPMACVKEKGQWKIDIAATAQAMMRSMMSSMGLPGATPK